MYPRNYAATDVGTTIRNPATALLCIDSEDRFADIQASRLISATDNPYDFLITKNENLLSGFFTRLGVTEVVFPWTVPNINRKSNIILVYWDDGVSTFSSWIQMPIGFYKPSQIASELQTIIRALDGPNLGAFTMTYGDNNENHFVYNTNNVNVSIAFNPITTANITTLPSALLKSFWGSIDLRSTHQLFDILGLNDPDNTGFSGPGPHTGGYTLCQSTRYIDIVSTQLTYNQALKDSSTSIISRDVLCRVYLADGSAASDVAPSSPDFCPYGCAPFTVYRDFSSPKFINWTPNQNVPGSVRFTVYGDDGGVLDRDPANDIYNPRVYWSLTLQVSEN